MSKKPKNAVNLKSDKKVEQPNYEEKIEKITDFSGYPSLDEIVGQENVVREFQHFIQSVRFHELYSVWRQERPKGILLCGNPGTGKTAIVKAAAKELSGEVLLVELRYLDIASKWVDAPLENLRAVFRFIEKESAKKHVLLFIDEIDSMIPSRNLQLHETSLKRVNAFLEWLDGGLSKLQNVTLIGATNHLAGVDEALLRPGRMDKILLLEELNSEDFVKGLEIYLRKRNLEEELVGKINWELIKKRANGLKLSGANLPDVINRIVEKKISTQIALMEKHSNSESEVELEELIGEPISTKDFLQEVEEMQKLIGDQQNHWAVGF